MFPLSLIKYFMLVFMFIQSGWSIPVELVIGPDVGIAYTTDSAVTVSTIL